MGIRLESYNALTRKFETPYYVLLQRVQGSRNSDGERDREGQGERDEDEEEEDAPLRVHRHTLPPYIPLQNLVSKYLPLPSATQPSKRQKQDLGRFVRALRFEVVARSRRMEAVERLKENVEGRGGERGVRSVQAERQGGEIRVEWVDGVKAKIEVAERGDVVEVEVLGTDGRRERGLEGRILGRRVEDLEGLLGG